MIDKKVLPPLSKTYSQTAQTGITCPKCTDAYDYTSCTQTMTCHNSHDVCELQVHLADKNRLSYVCHNSHACTNHEAHACDINNHEMCAYCCSSVDACKKQREEVFAKLAVTQPAPAATTMAAMMNTTMGMNMTNTTMMSMMNTTV
ncbi:hypothetical protein ElyMa_002879500 [Elysia marginata]|uniref:Uncharacterized protein n=1 Tax=Elysia marginata TaxID=1093978 RepID=A0AAV4HZD6_9GAST|nr:hypothetical protein ElyMa_002879500 [Elysia marginata]